MMSVSHSLSVLPSRKRFPGVNEIPMKEESLPFTIRAVSNASDLEKAVLIRHAAYKRHVPGFAEALKTPEKLDSEQGVVVLLAESKLDGSPIGTMRIQTNDFKPLTLEQSVTLPQWLSGPRLAEATRLGVTQERVGRMVTTALFKAFFLYCRQQRVDWMVITARAPVDRHYDRLLFKDVYPGLGYIPFKHVGNMPHRVMSFNVNAAHDLWAAAEHPLFNFVFTTYHEDINVSTPALHRRRPSPPLMAEQRFVMSA